MPATTRQRAYPVRTMRILKQIAIATEGECRAFVRDYRAGFQFSGEVWTHAGIPLSDWIRSAYEHRHAFRRLHGPYRAA
jgi:hypothetical protein